MQLTKPQILSLYNLLNFLVDSNIEIKALDVWPSAIIVKAEPVKGEIENRVWKIFEDGEVKDVLGFFHD